MTAEINRCYRVLELEPGASLEQVKQAWRELVKVWHPDRFPNDVKLQSKAQERLKDINGAYEMLERYLNLGSPPPNDRVSSFRTSDRAQQQGRRHHESQDTHTETPPPQPPPPTSSQKKHEAKSDQKIFVGWVVAAVLIVGSFLWFNRYSFSEMKSGGSTFPVRTSRFTDKSEVFVMGRWKQIGGASSAKSFVLGPDELRKIDGRAGIRPPEYTAAGEAPKVFMSCSVYNGSSHSLADLTVRLEIKETDKQKGIIRDYRLRPNNGGVVPPLSNGDFEADIGLAVREEGQWSWGIIGASGVR